MPKLLSRRGHGTQLIGNATLPGEGLGRPAITFGASFGGGKSILSGGTHGGGQLVWNWGTDSFDSYAFGGGWASVGAGPNITAGSNYGIGVVYDLPNESPELYEGYFDEAILTINPGGIGGYAGIAAPRGEGPWSIGWGLNLGTPGYSATWAPTWYRITEEFQADLVKIKQQVKGTVDE